MTDLLLKMTGGTWKYPKTKTVLAVKGLHTIEHYVQVRRARILRWVEGRPILELCRSAERRYGITPRLCWREQSMYLDKASTGAPTYATTEGDRGDGGRAPYPLDRKSTTREALCSATRTGTFFEQIVLGLRTFRLTYP